tara:strand:+ start:34 stop:390 length:357 start_codon:yes stop_codon:yes gene_type:complete
MTEKVEAEKELKEKPKKSLWTTEDKKNISNYGCQLLVDDASQEQIQERKLPTDTMIVTYSKDGKVYKDLCRGPRVNIFDLYYDKFGKDALQKIDYGHGTVNPGQWGYKAPEKKRRRKG